MRIILVLSITIISFSTIAKTTYQIPRVNQAPKIDAELSEGEWSSAQQVELLYNTYPGDNLPAPVKTTAYMMEDGESIYFAFRAYDPEPEKILAFIQERDGIYQDDFVGVILDTFNDERKGYEFFVNPMGSQGELSLDETQNNSEDSSWNAVWDSAGQVTDEGYIVEMAIPFRVLRYTSNLDKQTWGIHFIRKYPRDSRMNISDRKKDRTKGCGLCQDNKIEGMPYLKSSSTNLDITPTVTYINNETREVAPVTPWEETNNKADFGMDMRWALTEDWILNATLNPDFSQVEADVGQLDINTTFSLFYPEARPFFLDGADYFNTNNQLVHTRNIADPDYGVKVSGKTNGYSLGVIAASDESTSFLIPSSQGSYVVNLEEQSSEVLIGRGQIDVGEKNNVGVLLTNRSATDYKNQVFSLDGRYYFTDKDYINYQYMRSDSDNPDSIRFDEDDGEELMAANQSDDALTVSYRHNEKNSSLSASYSDFGKDFRADVGFISKVDYKQFAVAGQHIWDGEAGSKWNRWGFFGEWDTTKDQSGLKLEEESELFFLLNGPMQFMTEIGIVNRDKYYDGKYFDEQFFVLWFQIKPFSGFTIGSYNRIGDSIDYSNTQLGEEQLFEPYVNLQIGKHFNVEFDYTNKTLDVSAGELFKAELFDLRFAYQFNNRSRLSLTLQATNIFRNTNLYLDNQDTDPDNDVDAKNKNFGTQLIYSYKINPQTLLYIGYSDNALENDNVQSLEKTDKAIFAKFSYLWQM
ncbi:MAG: carbohydrate binding family 9 domain-containing protein [Gammaproteobacteria bacterium]|nr:carbohydrate binding family 9 domain-containing protein [Gammaproteobacteria bacterium]